MCVGEYVVTDPGTRKSECTFPVQSFRSRNRAIRGRGPRLILSFFGAFFRSFIQRSFRPTCTISPTNYALPSRSFIQQELRRGVVRPRHSISRHFVVLVKPRRDGRWRGRGGGGEDGKGVFPAGPAKKTPLARKAVNHAAAVDIDNRLPLHLGRKEERGCRRRQKLFSHFPYF